MKKKIAAFLAMSVVIVVSVLFLLPTYLFAPPSVILNPDNGHYYSVVIYSVPSSNNSWTEARNEAETMTYKPDPNGPIYYGHLVTITSQEESMWINTQDEFINRGGLWIGAYQTPETDGIGIDDKWNIDWNWVTGEGWQFTNWRSGEPSDSDDVEDYGELRSSNGGDWNDNQNVAVLAGYIVEYEIKPAALAPYVEPVWVRDSDMKCKQVWVNEDNKFQFSFIYSYKDNNWVKIYDMSGKEVFSIDMPYDNPNIIVDLPNGMYTVKTFSDQLEPIQTFVIGK
jgi:hypothetical protein